MGRTRASIKDVAEAAGVSVGTVSNVLNRPDSVSETTRAKVNKSMAELGFVRNATARQLRAGHSEIVGVIVLDLANPFYTGLARGIEDRLAQDSQLALLCSSDDDSDREARYLRQFLEQGVRGILITPAQTTAAQIDTLKNLDVPVVLLDAHAEQINSVSVDNVSGARLAVSHLIETGRTDIVLVNGPWELQQCQERAAGAQAAAVEAGLNPHEAITEIRLDDLTADAGAQALGTWLDTNPKPTGIFCVNDIVALGVMRELSSRGISVPEDVGVVGYDDVPLAAELRVPLTSVRQPMGEIGYAAAAMLLSEPDSVEHIQFSPELIIRASSQP